MSTSAGAALEEQALAIIRKFADGITDKELASELSVAANQRGLLINKLLSEGRIKVYKNGKVLVYKEVDAESAAKLAGLTREETLVYQTIKNAGNTGVWTKDLKLRTNLPQPHITKILRTLESRTLVKSVKNVNNPSRKVYMLAELEPSRDLTGGAWYTEHQFDSAFIDVLREACMAFIERKGDTTLRDLAKFIHEKKFAKVDLRDEDIHSIVLTLMYDGRIDIVEGDDPGDDAEHYRPMLYAIPDFTAFTDVPCGACPIMDQCRDDGIISPASCEYYNKWLAF